MNYTLKGSLCGYLCQDCIEPLYGMEVLLYLPSQNNEVIRNTVASTKDTFHLVTDKERDAKKDLLIAKSKTDEQGHFEFSVDEKYANTAFDIDFVCGNVPHTPPKPHRKEPVQFHLTTFFPQWRIDKQRENYFYNWQYCIAYTSWCYIRGQYFDAWVICGNLRNCTTGKPIANATVQAWDADLITDDNLGSAVTDANGHFRIDYTGADFKINFLPFNVETDPSAPFFSSGPDVYFKADIAGISLINETAADRRNNVGYCLCVDLCTPINVVNPNDAFPSAWTGIGSAFNINTGTGPKDFDADGYAGSGKYALSSVINLTGQAPAKSLAGNPIEYRFVISDNTTPNGGAAPALASFTKIIGVTPALFVPSTVAQLVDTSFNVYEVVSDQVDFDSQGWFDINSAIARTQMIYGLGDLSNYSFIDYDTLLSLNTAALTTAPDVAAGVANAGDVFPAGSKIPIEKIAIRFEIREVVNKPANIFNTIAGSGKTLNSAIINNNSSFLKFAVQELQVSGNCAPISGILHAKYTVHHPHLQSISINVHNNSWSVNKSLSDGFIPLSNNISAAINSANNSSLQINATPNDLVRCTYSITLYVQRRLHDGVNQLSHEEQQILFFYDI